MAGDDHEQHAAACGFIKYSCIGGKQHGLFAFAGDRGEQDAAVEQRTPLLPLRKQLMMSKLTIGVWVVSGMHNMNLLALKSAFLGELMTS